MTSQGRLSAAKADSTATFVETNFQKCHCMQFLQDPRDRNKCGCGRDKSSHDPMGDYPVATGNWRWPKHVLHSPTDAYGTIEFSTGVHAQYLRLSPGAKPMDIVQLLTDHWGADPPKLVISVHGGMNSFDLPSRVKRAFRRSLQRMAAVPGCWIITSGLNVGVSGHVGDALTAGVLRRNRAVIIGIAPWGILAARNRLCIQNANIHYYPPPTARPASVLNPNHSFFLLVDDGSSGKYGQEVQWRREFEREISTRHYETQAAPLVAMLVEGGGHCITLAVDYITESIPVVVVSDSGRASNVISLAMRLNDSGNQNEGGSESNALDQTDLDILSASIQQAFGYHEQRNKTVLNQIVLSTKRRRFITLWQAPETAVLSGGHLDLATQNEELDVCVLSALLKARRRTAPEQFYLALAWNRVDLANREMFANEEEWTEQALHECMLEALFMNRVEFVKLLLKQGVNMSEVLNYKRLEQLYNIKSADARLLRQAARVLGGGSDRSRLTLVDVGATLDALIGYGYRSSYETRAHMLKYIPSLRSPKSLLQKIDRFFGGSGATVFVPGDDPNRFKYPFSELLTWAVLMQRQPMAQLMCSQGEETLAKALIASRLYRSMAQFSKSDVTSEITVQLKQYGKEFAKWSVDLLDKCQQVDEVLAQQLLTYELGNFGGRTCLSLAVAAQNKHLVAHPCSQNLLDVLWMGGLRSRSTRPSKILLGIICPPYALLGLQYLSLQELASQPQTEAEIEDRIQNELEMSETSSFTEEHSPSAEASPTQASPISRYYSIGRNSIKRPKRKPRSSNLKAGDSGSPTKRSPPLREEEEEENNQTGEQCGDIFVIVTPPQETRTPTVTFERNATTSTSQVSIRRPKQQPSVHGYSRSRLSRMADLEDHHGTQLPINTRFSEFYYAPVTKFWLHTIGYLVFIMLFCLTILTEAPMDATEWPEIYITAYVLTLVIDKLREIFAIDALRMSARLEIFFLDTWNIFDALGIGLFLIGLLLRWIQHLGTFEASRAMWIIAVVFFLIHIFDIFQANNSLATYIMILQKMMQKMISFLIILGVVVAMYGVVLGATRFPFRKPTWDILKDVWVEPYFNLYGETYHEFIDTRMCSNDKNSLDREKPPCWCCTWIGPVAQAAYLIVANILMLNLLVAVFNSVYEKVNVVSKALTRFQRYRLIVDYQMLPVLPPPFTLVSHMFMLVRSLIRWMKGRPFRFNPGLLKVVLADTDLAVLHDFEDQARDELEEQIQQAKASPHQATEDHLRAVSERVEAVQLAVEQLALKQTAMMGLMREFEADFLLRSKPRTPRESFSSPSQSVTLPPTDIEAEESSARALDRRLFKRLRAVSVSNDDVEYSKAARKLLAVEDVDETASMASDYGESASHGSLSDLQEERL